MEATCACKAVEERQLLGKCQIPLSPMHILTLNQHAPRDLKDGVKAHSLVSNFSKYRCLT